MGEGTQGRAGAALRCLAALRLPETFRHERLVGQLCAALCARLGMPPDTCAAHRIAAELHDVGKLALPDTVLNKPAPLTAEEFALVRQHSLFGHQVLTAAREPELALAAEMALSHHERWDGSGYPHRLRGNAIPPAARLVALCDVYSALREPRPYKVPMPHEQAVRLLLHGDPARDGFHPGQFDPVLLTVLANDPNLFRNAFDAAD